MLSESQFGASQRDGWQVGSQPVWAGLAGVGPSWPIQRAAGLLHTNTVMAKVSRWVLGLAHPFLAMPSKQKAPKNILQINSCFWPVCQINGGHHLALGCTQNGGVPLQQTPDCDKAESYPSLLLVDETNLQQSAYPPLTKPAASKHTVGRRSSEH